MSQGKKGTSQIIEPSPFTRRQVERRRIGVDIDVTLAARLHTVSRQTRLSLTAIVEKALEKFLPILEYGPSDAPAEDND